MNYSEQRAEARLLQQAMGFRQLWAGPIAFLNVFRVSSRLGQVNRERTRAVPDDTETRGDRRLVAAPRSPQSPQLMNIEAPGCQVLEGSESHPIRRHADSRMECDSMRATEQSC
jgi:hypothetical protein